MRRQHDTSLAEAFAQASRAYGEGRAAEARRLARQIVDSHPDFGGGHYLLGVLALDQGQHRRAAEHLARAVAATPDEPAPRLALGRAQEAEGNANTAILHYRAILSRQPGHAEANARLGELLRRSGKADEALAHCRAAVAADSRHAEALNTLGALLHQRGEAAEAAAALGRALSLRPDWPSALNNLGVVLRALGRLDESVAVLTGAVDLRRDHAGSRANLAGVLRALGRLQEARVQAERATKLDPRHSEAWLELGLIRQAGGHAEGAAAAFERAVALTPAAAPAQFCRAQFCLAEAALALGQPERARTHYRACLENDPADRHGAALGLALAGGAPPPDKAPEAYVRQLFDDYAEGFDAALVERLDYRAPQLLAEALARTLPGAAGLAVLDAGCGTGLAAPVLRPLAATLDGVDLSPAMVGKARARGLYDRLDVAELVSALDANPAAYDLIVAADVLVYLGALDAVFRAVRRALKPGGAFAFTVERVEGEPATGAGFILGPKQRYAHAPAYIRTRAAAEGFVVALMEDAATRREAGVDVPGLVVVGTLP